MFYNNKNNKKEHQQKKKKNEIEFDCRKFFVNAFLTAHFKYYWVYIFYQFLAYEIFDFFSVNNYWLVMHKLNQIVYTWFII